MCYGSGCLFERSDGECCAPMLGSDFSRRFIHQPCTFGGVIQGPDDEEYYKELEHNIAYQYAKRQLMTMDVWKIQAIVRRMQRDEHRPDLSK